MSTKAIQEKYNINKHGCYIVLDEAGVPRRMKRGKQLESDTAVDIWDTTGISGSKASVTPAKTLDIQIPATQLKGCKAVTITINLTEED
jgi:predicted amino acid dehydrogenase